MQSAHKTVIRNKNAISINRVSTVSVMVRRAWQRNVTLIVINYKPISILSISWMLVVVIGQAGGGLWQHVWPFVVSPRLTRAPDISAVIGYLCCMFVHSHHIWTNTNYQNLILVKGRISIWTVVIKSLVCL
jgi:hypothetical protein